MKQIVRILSVSQFEVIMFGYLATSVLLFIAVSILGHNSYMQLYFDSLKSSLTITQNYDAISLQINSNEYVANGTVFIFWSIVGLLVYYLVYFFFLSERNIETFFHTLFTKGVNQLDLLDYAFARIGIRTLATIGVLTEIVLFVKFLLPYLIANLNISDAEHIFATRGLSLFWMVVGIFVYLHAGTVLLRCLMLRTRVIL